MVGVAIAAGWGVAVFFLLQTETPALALPKVDAASIFSPAELDRIEAYRGLSRWLWAGATALELVALALVAWKARPLARICRRLVGGRVRTGVALALVAVLAAWLAALPVAAVQQWWRRRYGLSEQGYVAWVGDHALELAVLAAVVGLCAAGAVWLAGRLGRRWWIAGGAALATFGLLYVLVQPLVVQPLFNDYRPLRDRALATEIELLGTRLGVDVSSVEVADASRRTTAANAMVAGIGPTRRVILYDTLLDGRFTRGEIAFVSAHELAHVGRLHVWKAAAWFALFAVPGVALVAWVTERRGGLRDPALVPLGLLVVLALTVAVLPAQNGFWRRYEAEADWLALTATRDAEAAIGLQRRFVLTGLVDPDPPAWARIMLGTHPTPLERIGMAEAFARLQP